MARVTKDILVPLDTPDQRVDLLVQQATSLSRSIIRGMFDHDCVQVDGVVCHDPGMKVAGGSQVALRYDPHMRYKEKPKAHKSALFDLVFEDEHLIVVNKKAGYLTVPNNPGDTQTLVNAVKIHVNRGQARGRPVAIVHRLDRDTSGLLVFGKNARIGDQLKDQFAGRKPERVYVAIVAGKVKDVTGTIRSYLATDKDLNQRSVEDEDEGKLAITHYTVTETFREATMVRVTLETGRRNQIRVHFAEMGHPILGEQRYEVDQARHPLWPHKRLALHAEVLGFTHPVTGKTLRFEVAVPSEFGQFFKRAGR